MHDSTTRAAHHGKDPAERGAEESTPTATGQHSSQGRIGGDSPVHRCVSVRASGTAGEKGTSANSIAGGILSQLIEMLNDRLAETRDCIQWYEKEEQKINRQLANLEALQHQYQESETE